MRKTLYISDIWISICLTAVIRNSGLEKNEEAICIHDRIMDYFDEDDYAFFDEDLFFHYFPRSSDRNKVTIEQLREVDVELSRRARGGLVDYPIYDRNEVRNLIGIASDNTRKSGGEEPSEKQMDFLADLVTRSGGERFITTISLKDAALTKSDCSMWIDVFKQRVR